MFYVYLVALSKKLITPLKPIKITELKHEVTFDKTITFTNSDGVTDNKYRLKNTLEIQVFASIHL